LWMPGWQGGDMDYIQPIRDSRGDICGFLDELRPVARLSWEEYSGDIAQRRIAERVLELLLEAAADIARMYLYSVKESPGNSKAAAIRKLVELRVLTSGLGTRLVDVVDAQNVFAHTYRGIDDRRVYNLVQQADDLFTQYVAAVEAALPPETGD